ncbi:MAG: hypothetical protein WAN28_21560, partial [Terracidiphilus sp.]
YGLVLPMMIANMSAFVLARRWRHTAVYDALLEQDGIFLHELREPTAPDTAEGMPEPPLFAKLGDKGTFVD